MLKKTLAGVAVAVTALLITPVPAHAGRPVYNPLPNVFYEINNWNSGKCLDVAGESTAEMALVIQTTCRGSWSQQWRLVPVNGFYYEIRARHSDKCLDVAWGSLDDNAYLIQANCWGGWNQHWAPLQYASTSPVRSWIFFIIPEHAVAAGMNRCLSVLGGSPDDNTPVVSATHTDHPSQFWSFSTV